jgi:hypothetical protein
MLHVILSRLIFSLSTASEHNQIREKCRFLKTFPNSCEIMSFELLNYFEGAVFEIYETKDKGFLNLTYSLRIV